jgi:hypothetical protein
MLEKEYSFFEEIRDNLVKEHLGEYVAIKGNKILDFYKSQEEALENLSQKHEPGTFLIQHCVSEETETQVFHTRAVI